MMLDRLWLTLIRFDMLACRLTTAKEDTGAVTVSRLSS
jgi:hypothetical protein